MKKLKLISSLITLSFLITVLLSIAFLTVSAATTDAEEEDEEDIFTDYTAEEFKTADEKLATMQLVHSNYGYDLYYHPETAEIAVRHTVTDGEGNLRYVQDLFSNPYDLASTNATTDIKKQLLSQVIIKYVDNDDNITFYSYKDAAESRQIVATNIRGGLRVEYTVGRTNPKRVLPKMIRKERFEELILNPIMEANERASERLMALYQLKDVQDPTITERQRRELEIKYPITKKMAIYIIEATIVEREMNLVESWILEYTGYTYDDVLADHEETQYVGTDKVPAVFRFALEYYIEEDGLRVRLPANGIRYDASQYQLTSIQVLPYMGSGNLGTPKTLKDGFKGYAMIPDGSGTLVRFEEQKSALTITGRLYGQDYSFHNLNITPNMETWRMPVFGLVQDYVKVTEEKKKSWGDYDLFEGGREITEIIRTEEIVPQGYVAIVTEGETLTELTYEYGGGTLHKYHSVFPVLYPRPKDTYPLDGISVSGGTATWTVQTDRRYSGNYTIKYVMLYQDDANYVGMAKVYREYLEKQGVLRRIKNKEDIPLYIESFGTIDTIERKFGVPVKVKTPLTTFGQAQEMLSTLIGQGITNIKLKFTGWYNGGLESKAPTKIKVEKEMGGKKGLLRLAEFASANGIVIYPDVDFTYLSNFGVGDKFSSKKQAVKTVDDRTASHKTYNPVFQAYLNDGSIIISPRVIKSIYGMIREDFTELQTGAISVGTLGSELNSDQNEDEPLNREDTKARINELLSLMQSDQLSLMTNAGNSYILRFVDHILNVPLDGSSRLAASEEIPFVGMVLHGYKDFSGTAINLAGDYQYNLLKTIENGANPYFVLSYANTSELKNSYKFNQYYSVEFNIWHDDLVETYNTLNELLKPVRTSLIVAHERIAYRVVKVTYENGTSFLLNYNNHAVAIDEITIEAMGYLVQK